MQIQDIWIRRLNMLLEAFDAKKIADIHSAVGLNPIIEDNA